MYPTECIAKWNSEHGLDTVEPVRNENGNFQAVVGAYTLASEGNRVGGIHLVSANQSTPSLESIAFTPLPAVLDSRVCGDGNRMVLVACADGSLRCLLLPTMEEQWKWDAGHMLLSLSIVKEDGNDVLLSLSDSSGRVLLVKATPAGCTPVHEADVHSAEAWTVDAVDESQVFSGGDDAFLFATDLRSKDCVWKKRAHTDVGVTSIVCRGSHHLYTGGYDDCLKIWDTRSMKQPLAEKNLGGGVWRIKFHPARADLLLVACMYDGFKVVKVNDNSSIDVHAQYKGHESIAYGAAWAHDENQSSNDVFGLTASFYDKSLQLWSTKGIST